MHILINLIKNAREAMIADFDNHDRKLVITLYQEERRLRIMVSDNGIGISSDDIQHIFEHGFTTKRSGNGFGLHFCANAAEELGGKLTVQSLGPGEGTTFLLILELDPQS